jgi:5'-deoxynucleotidase
MMARLKWIDRWALMRNSADENLAQHSLEVGMLSHALCVNGNERLGKHLDADRAAVIGMYHDGSEILTGDMPTPVKYKNDELRGAYKDVEREAEEELLATLPDDLRPTFAEVFVEGDEPTDVDEAYLLGLVKAADRLSAYLKCVEEEATGNTEFRTAAASTLARLEELRASYPEVGDFMDEFLPAYGHTLDELLG